MILDDQLLTSYIDQFNRADEETVYQQIPNAQAAAWLARQAPLFECLDPAIQQTYYFRWWVYRKHIKQTDARRRDRDGVSPSRPMGGKTQLHQLRRRPSSV